MSFKRKRIDHRLLITTELISNTDSSTTFALRPDVLIVLDR